MLDFDGPVHRNLEQRREPSNFQLGLRVKLPLVVLVSGLVIHLIISMFLVFVACNQRFMLIRVATPVLVHVYTGFILAIIC